MGGGDGNSVLPGVAVHGAQAFVFEDQGDPTVTWLHFQGVALGLCNCCGILGSGISSHIGRDIEYPKIQAAKSQCSTCRHAATILDALDRLSLEFGVSDWDSLVTTLPLLLGRRESDAEDDLSSTTVCFAKNLGKRAKVPVFGVLCEETWAVVVIRPTGNRHKLAACHLLSCQTRPWGCIHAKAVSRHNRVETSYAESADMRRTDALAFGPDSILMGDAPASLQTPAASSGAPSSTQPPAVKDRSDAARTFFIVSGR